MVDRLAYQWATAKKQMKTVFIVYTGVYFVFNFRLCDWQLNYMSDVLLFLKELSYILYLFNIVIWFKNYKQCHILLMK